MNIMQIMKQAQAVQGKVQQAQERLATLSHEGSAGGGSVKITLSGDGKARSVTIDPAAVSDVEMLQDMILIAINDAKGKADAASAEAMKQATGGLNLPPGMNLPF